MNYRLATVGVIVSTFVLSACTSSSGTIASPEPTLAPEATAPPPSTPMPSTSPSPGSDSSVSVIDQKAGKSVVIGTVDLTTSGFVMIHEADANNQPGTVIGNSVIFKGTKKNLVIKLTQTPKAGDQLFAMLHADVNHNGKVEFPGPDVPLVDASGNIIMTEFNLTGPSPAPTPSPSPSSAY